MRKAKRTWGRYIQQVLSGEIVVCKEVRLACKRHVKDMKLAKQKGMVFDAKHANLAIGIIETLTHTKGDFAGKPLKLEPWQQFAFASLYGWWYLTGRRRYSTVFFTVPRKEGKSTIGAGVGLLEGLLAGVMGDGSPEVYSAATTRDQAKIVWEQAEAFVKQSYLKDKHVKAWSNSLEFVKNGGFFKATSSDASTQDGLNPSCVILDEYHAHPDDELRNVLRSGMGARPNPLFFMITTAGLNKKVPCYQEQQMARQILEGQIENDTYFALIYTLDEGDDWRDEKNWYKANPNLDVSVSIEDMRAQYREAVASPSKENEFKTKRLNIWTRAATRWLRSETWAKNQDPVDPVALKGRRCFVAFDLSTVLDLTAAIAIFPPIAPDEKYKGLCRFYIPEENLYEREKSEKMPYTRWVEDGFITATPGPTISYAQVEADALDWAESYQIQEAAYDPYNAQNLVENLENAGLLCVKFNQNILSQSPALKEFERLHLEGRVAWGNNPVMSYMASCAEIWSDSNANLKLVKPDRRKSSSRIDGIAAGAMALYRAVINASSSTSAYDDRGLLYL